MSEETEPAVRVVRGHASDEELAALVAVLAAKAVEAPAAPAPRPSSWAAYWRTIDAAVPTGRDGWRASGLPR